MKFTVLTRPIFSKGFLKNVDNPLKVIARDRLRWWKNDRFYKYNGHHAVTRSLIEGFNKIGYTDYNFQPDREKDVEENVHVLWGVDTLRYALYLKKIGRVKHISCGPTICDLPMDYDGIVCNKDVELFLLPSEWIVNLFIRIKPELKSVCKVWYSGIDMNLFRNIKHEKSNTVILYQKGYGEPRIFRLRIMVL